LEGAPGFFAPCKFENIFFKLGSIHIQFKTLQEFQVILLVRIRTKLAIVKQPTVDAARVPENLWNDYTHTKATKKAARPGLIVDVVVTPGKWHHT